MPETTGTRPLTWYDSCAPDHLWEEDESKREDDAERADEILTERKERYGKSA